MNSKLNKYVIIIAVICTIIPLNIIIIKSGFMNYLFLYVPMIIGYILYFIQYKQYSNNQKRILNIATCFSIINLLAGLWEYSTSKIHINTFGDISLDMVIAPLLFSISYFGHRIVSLILCIKLIRNEYSKIKIMIIIVIIIIALILLPQIFNPYNYAKI